MSGEKTEDATDKRLQDAREKGQTPQRKNVSEAFSLVTGSILVAAMLPMFVNGMTGLFDVVLGSFASDLQDKRGELIQATFKAMRYNFIITASLASSGFLLHMLLNNFNFAPKSMTPKFEKFNPINGLKGIFSKNTLYTFGRLLVFFSACTGILFMIMSTYLGEVLEASNCGVPCVADVFVEIFILTLVLLIGTLVLLAAFDFKIQNTLFKNQNKMTKDEVKREYKGAEGDPMIKSKRKFLAQEAIDLPGIRDANYVVYSGGFMVALAVEDGYLPFVVLKASGDNVQGHVSKFRKYGAKCVNLPDIAREFFNKAATGSYMKRDSIEGMQKIINNA